MTRYAASWNVPGYLPDTSDGVVVFDTPREAWAYLWEEHVRACEDAGDGAWRHKAQEFGAAQRHDTPGVVYTPTPGGRMHDLGLAYTVEPVMCECAYVPGDSDHELHCPIRG